MAFIPETCFTCRHNRTRPMPDFCAKCCAVPKGDPDHAWEPEESEEEFEICECGRPWNDCATRDGAEQHRDRS